MFDLWASSLLCVAVLRSQNTPQRQRTWARTDPEGSRKPRLGNRFTPVWEINANRTVHTVYYPSLMEQTLSSLSKSTLEVAAMMTYSDRMCHTFQFVLVSREITGAKATGAAFAPSACYKHTQRHRGCSGAALIWTWCGAVWRCFLKAKFYRQIQLCEKSNWQEGFTCFC